MRTVQMTLDEGLLEMVDRVVKKLRTNRSAFTRKALEAAIFSYNTSCLEQKQQQAYMKQPITEDEFGFGDDDQSWGD